MDIWDGLSSVRDETAVRASAGNDHAEVISQIQKTQREVNLVNPAQTELNRLAIIVNAGDISTNVTDIGTNTTDIGTNVTNIGTNTSDISNLIIVVGTNTTDIGDNTSDISNLTIVVGTNTSDIGTNVTDIGTNATDIGNLTIVVGTNTSNISTNTSNISNLMDQVLIELTNNDSVTITTGTPVYSDFRRAKADSSSTNKVIGLAYEDTDSSDPGRIQVTGIITATTGEWDVVTGDSGGLTPNTLYYLSEITSGKLKAVAPTTGYVSPIGVAISTTQLRIEILNTILL